MAIVHNRQLARVSQELGFPKYILTGPGAETVMTSRERGEGGGREGGRKRERQWRIQEEARGGKARPKIFQCYEY